MRILLFIVFLVAYIVWLWALGALSKSKRGKRDILMNKTFRIDELRSVLSLAGLFTFLFVLSGYFNWRLLTVFFVAAQIGMVLTAILSGMLGSVASRWGAHAFWAGVEFAWQHKGLISRILLLPILACFAYPLATGISYFRLPSAEMSARILQYTLCLFFLMGLPLTLFLVISALVSENLDEDTRTRFFVSQLSALVPTALWVALLFWSFGIKGVGRTFSVGGVPLELSPLLIGVLIGFFVLTSLIPYLIGAQRGKKWRSALLEKRKSWMVKLEDILGEPVGSLYLPKLATLQDALGHEIEEFVANDPMIDAGIQLDKGTTPPGLEEIAFAYKLARNDDPRFKHLDLLHQMSEMISEIRTDIGKLTTEPKLEKAAKEWIDYLHPRKDELNKELALATKTRTPAMLIYTIALLPIFTVIVTSFANWLWAYFSKSLPQ